MMRSKGVQMCGEGAENLQGDDGYDIIDSDCKDHKGGMNAWDEAAQSGRKSLRAELERRSASLRRLLQTRKSGQEERAAELENVP